MNIEIETQNIDVIAARFRRAPRTAADLIEKNLRTVGGLLVRQMRIELRPVKYTGQTERSVSTEYTANPPIYEIKVGPTAKQREVIRTGSKPHYAPIAPLKVWARWKLGDESAAYAVQKSIAKHGTSKWLERKGIGERVPGHGIGLDYVGRTMQRSAVKNQLERTQRRIPLEIADALAGE